MTDLNLKFEFSKMQGTGNDFIVVEKDNLPEDIDFSLLAKMVCDRRFGIGSDGLLIIAGHFDADFEMIMYNPDGSLAEMCGNGIRCVGKYIHDKELLDENLLRIKTGAGIIPLKLHTGDMNRVERVEVAMGHPDFSRQNIPVAGDGETALAETLKLASGLEIEFHAVAFGNPHAVILVDDVDNYPVQSVGPEIETHVMFPNRINVEFVQHISPEQIRVRIWERGAGETLSCGTGVCAAAAVTRRLNLVGTSVKINVRGGDLLIRFDEENALYLEGPCVEVFRGTYIGENII